MHLHILGIAGTFMGGLAQLARAAGHQVTGSDAKVYPPMSTQLAQAGIEFTEGFEPAQLDCQPEQVVVGNIMSRGKPVVERMLNERLRYTSGPQWLFENVLQQRRVIAVSGTHGKTTTASMVAWILEYAGLNPGFLIGGVPENFSCSARLGQSEFFVIEADEYDTAFFDKRSKFVHYHPEVLVINNLEFDHADIFADLAAIQTQFHHLLRMVPSDGCVIRPQHHAAIDEVEARGCWSPVSRLGHDASADWSVAPLRDDYSYLEFSQGAEKIGVLEWDLIGQHNADNALAALVAAQSAGVKPNVALAALAEFKGVKRRLQLKGEQAGVRVYDDFAHHPTAIQTTLEGVRKHVGQQRVVAVFEPRSNSMQAGAHSKGLAEAFAAADLAIVMVPAGLTWDLEGLAWPCPLQSTTSIDALLQQLSELLKAGDHVVIMSNGGFGGIHDKLIELLKQRGQGA